MGCYKPYWPSLDHIEKIEYQYHGENSLTEIKNVASLVVTGSFDAIIGVGGGKVLHLTKSAGNATHKPTVLIPTLASNCSPWTPVSVIYDDAGAFTRFDVYPVGASLV